MQIMAYWMRIMDLSSVVCASNLPPRLLELLNKAQWEEIDRHVPIGRAATPEEIAATLLFMSSDLAAHVNGVVMPVDGGVSVTAALPDLEFGKVARTGTA